MAGLKKSLCKYKFLVFVLLCAVGILSYKVYAACNVKSSSGYYKIDIRVVEVELNGGGTVSYEEK